MNILYVSYLCPDCPPAEEKLNQEGIAYEKKDIYSQQVIINRKENKIIKELNI